MLEHGEDSADAATSVDIILKIIELMTTNEQREVTERFARSANAPQRLIQRLCCEHPYIAEPALRCSPLIDAGFLDDIAHELSDLHLQTVAERCDLSEDTVQFLIDKGTPDVHVKIAHNLNINLTIEALTKLMRSAATRNDVEEALCGREDLPEKASDILMKRVARRLNQEVGSAANCLSRDALRVALRTSDASNGTEEADTRGLSLEAFTTITRLSREGRLEPDHLLEFARRRDFGAVIACFAKLANIPASAARRLATQPSTEALAVATRAADLDRNVFNAIVALRKSALFGQDQEDAAESQFEEMPVDMAQTIMTFHSARRGKFARLRSA
ncbi:MAG: DUF2336 domain-containing protein [Rhizobiales bacterium]|nr:DUF2336 domain-containing protein [Hyphomicrobiales bacterium]